MRGVVVVIAAGTIVFTIASAQAAPGQLDPTFGRGGKVTTTFPHATAAAHGMVVQRDGRIVVAGQRGQLDNGEFALARYRANGRLDRSFGGDGKVTTSFGSRAGGASAIALQRDGKIVVAGEALDRASGRVDFALARYRRNGAPDRTFGIDGKVRTLFGFFASASAVAVQRDGKIVAAGTTSTGGPFQLALAVARYRRDGSPDLSFGDGGQVQTELPDDAAVARAVAVQRDGRIIVAGYRYQPSGLGGPVHGVLLARYRPDGSLDTTFGHGGMVTTRIGGGGTATALALQRNARIVVAGTTIQQFTDVGPPFYDGSKVAVLRYRPDGTLDPTFASGGVATSQVGSNGIADAVALTRGGRIVVAGSTFGLGGEGPRSVFALIGYRANGSPDARFGRRGIVLTRLGDEYAEAHAVAVQRNGKLVAAGEAGSGRRRFALVRYRGFATR